MAASRPGESSGGASGSIIPFVGRVQPASDNAVSSIRDYDIPGVLAMLSSFRHCSFKEQVEALRKNLQSFKKPNAVGVLFKEEGEEDEDENDNVVDEVDDNEAEDEGVDDDDDEVDEVEEGENREVEEILKHQVPHEGERECKKPRLAEGFGCEGEAEAVI